MHEHSHGDAVARRLAATGSHVIDFAVSVNPLGPCPALIKVLREVDPQGYPDPACDHARESLGAHVGVSPERLVLGNGASELLWTLAKVLQNRDQDRALVVEPAFGEASLAAKAYGHAPVRFRVDDPARFDPAALKAAIADANPSFVYVANPTSPWGRTWSITLLAELIESTQPVPWIVDESFLSLSAAHQDARVPLPDSAIRLHSLGKALGLAGVRVAYAIVSPGLGDRIRATRPPWTVNAYALAVVRAIAESGAWIAESREMLLALAGQLGELLEHTNLRLESSQTIYGVMRVGNAASVAEHLLGGHHIAVRDCASFGMPEHIRVCARPKADLEKLVAAIVEVCR
ncbi:MAG: aminotransferase class I/II-fold pyridoxal phosphate-dependent enzyme [Myxococcota bacterium]